MSKYSVQVWDVLYYLVDENGDEATKEDGSVRLFHDISEDGSMIECPSEDDLEEVKDE